MTTSPSSTCSTIPQPTPQYGHTVFTLALVTSASLRVVAIGRCGASRRDPHVAVLDARRIRAHRFLRRLDALARAQVEMMLVERRCDDDPLAEAADQPAREHGGLRMRIDVADRERAAAAAVVDVEHGDLLAVDERAHAGVRHDLVERADGRPRGCLRLAVHGDLLAWTDEDGALRPSRFRVACRLALRRRARPASPGGSGRAPRRTRSSNRARRC
ncbi:hypothetical protein DO73_4649 [Burkholderia pseudomallei]|nr:hypothetical protein DO73_4649 [Burkholderia pseudomallei]